MELNIFYCYIKLGRINKESLWELKISFVLYTKHVLEHLMNPPFNKYSLTYNYWSYFGFLPDIG